MKKTIMMAIVATLSLTASAQIEKGMRYGIVFTGAMSKYSSLSDAGNVFGYGGGIVADYNFNKSVFLGTGLEFDLRGSGIETVQIPGQTLYVDGSLKSYNIVIPVNLGGRYNFSRTSSIYAQVGPYFSCAVVPAKLQILGYGDIKGERFDWGFNGKLGVEFSRFQIYGGYELGMRSIWGDDSKNRSITFGAAYMF